ncbi:MAG: DUF2196 domain-containing protein [Chloroflexota bacterium]
MSMSQHQVKRGSTVTIRNRSGQTVSGTVERVLPRRPNDPPGTRVELEDGEIGQVQSVEQD